MVRVLDVEACHVLVAGAAHVAEVTETENEHWTASGSVQQQQRKCAPPVLLLKPNEFSSHRALAQRQPRFSLPRGHGGLLLSPLVAVGRQRIVRIAEAGGYDRLVPGATGSEKGMREGTIAARVVGHTSVQQAEVEEDHATSGAAWDLHCERESAGCRMARAGW